MQGWTLIQYSAAGWSPLGTGEGKMGNMVEGKGTVAQIADQICTVVTNKGATIR